MTYQPQRRIFRLAGLAGMAFASLILGKSDDAMASDACDGFTQNGSLEPGTQIFFTSTNFAPGDQIVGSASGPPELSFYLRDETTGLTLTPSGLARETINISYTVARSTANHTINIYIDSPVPAQVATLNYSFSCTSAK